MPKLNKRKFNIFLCAILPFSAVISLGGVAFSSWIANETSTDSNVSVEVGSKADSPIVIGNFKMVSSSIYFDADGTKPSSENLEISFTGTTYYSMLSEWRALRPSLSLTNSTYQTALLDLINKNYINQPEFDDLVHESGITARVDGYEFGTSKSKWTFINGNSRNFQITSSFSYGSFFCGMKPTEFFASEEFNGEKIGNQYTIEEQNEIIEDIGRLNGATYRITLRVLTNYNSATITFRTNHTQGRFSTTNSADDIVYEDVLLGDYIYFPKVSFIAATSSYYYCSNIAGSATRFENSQGKWYRYDDLLSTLRYTEVTDLIFTANRAYSQSKLFFSWPSESERSQYATPTFTYHISPGSSSTTTSDSYGGYRDVTGTASYSVTNPYWVCGGDVVSIYITPSSNVASYKVYGFKEVADGQTLTKNSRLTIEDTYNANGNGLPRIEVTPVEASKTPIESASLEPAIGTGGTAETNGVRYTVSRSSGEGTLTVPIKLNVTPTNASIVSLTYTYYGRINGDTVGRTTDEHKENSQFTGSGTVTTFNSDMTFNVALAYNTNYPSLYVGNIYYILEGTITDGTGTQIDISFATSTRSNGEVFYSKRINIYVPS